VHSTRRSFRLDRRLARAVCALLLLWLGFLRCGQAQAQAITVPNSGFETPSVGSGQYQNGPSGASWTFGGISGIDGNGSTLSNPSAPEGQQGAFLKDAGTISESLSGFQANVSYTLTFSAAQGSSNQTGTQVLQVLLDGSVLGTVTPSGTGYTDYSTAAFTTTAGSHTLRISGLDASGSNNTAFLDNIRLTVSAPVYPPVMSVSTVFTPSPVPSSGSGTISIVAGANSHVLTPTNFVWCNLRTNSTASDSNPDYVNSAYSMAITLTPQGYGPQTQTLTGILGPISPYVGAFTQHSVSIGNQFTGTNPQKYLYPGLGQYSVSATSYAGPGSPSSTVAGGIGGNIFFDAAPSVSLTTPGAGAIFGSPANIAVTASAADSDGSVSKVDFYAGSTLIGTATTPPYTLNWTNVPTGSYSLTAVATDDAGLTKTSSPVAISVGSVSCTAATLSSLSITSTSGTVTLSGPALAGGQVISLSSSGASASVPSSVLVPSGQTSATFPVTTALVSSPVTVTITASYHGPPQTATLTVTGNPQVPQGGSAIPFAPSGTDAPDTVANPGTVIDILSPAHQVVAFITTNSGTSNGWTFSTDSTYLPTKFTVQAPAVATVAAGYEVRFSGYQNSRASAFFDVTPAGSPGSSGSGGSGSGGTGSGMTLTSVGLAQGFGLSTFVSHLPSDGNSGPLGSAMTPNGTVLITDFHGPGTAYTFKNVDNQDFSQVPSPALTAVTYPTAAQKQGAVVNYRGTLYAPGYELNPDGSVRRIIANIANGGDGVDVNPVTGHLIVSANPLLDVDPQTGAVTALFNVDIGPDGLAVSLDGSTVYTADNYNEQGQYVYGYDLGATDPTKKGAQVLKVAVPQPDGLALGAGTLSGYLFVNTNLGKVYEIALATGQATVIASGGSRGDYIGYSDDGTLFLSQSDKVLRLIPPPGASFGAGKSQSLYTRDDLTHSYSSFSLSSSQAAADAAQIAAFDTVAVAGTVTAAQMQRAGQVNFSGTQFDLQQGVRSVLSSALTSFAPVASAPALPSPDNYALAWSLPAAFLADIQTQLGDDCVVRLTDRISSLCGSVSVTDAPPQGLQVVKNILTLAVAGARNPQIPQGRSLDVTIAAPATSSQNVPAQGTWDILFNNAVVASSGNPAGWYAEDDHTAFGGVTVTVPTSAVASPGYTVRFSGQASGAGRFDVVPSGSVATAGILQPLVLSRPVVIGGGGTAGQVTARLTLDAPAPDGGAMVALTSGNPAILSVPAYVVIPEQQTTASFLVSTSAVAAPSLVPVRASYNGYRVAALAVVDPSGTPPSAPALLTATAGDARVALTWNAVSGASGYAVYRSTVRGGPYAALFAGLASPGYADAPLANGTTYYYVVSASNGYGESLGRSNEASATPLGPQVAAPTFSSPWSGQYSLPVVLADATPGAFIHYTLDGTAPTEASPVYGVPPTLYATTTVQARAYKTGNPPSAVASQTYTVTSGNPYATTESLCGGTLSDSLLATDPPSPEKGAGFSAKFYKYQAVAGETITITVTPTGFSPPFIYLHDPSGATVASTYTGPLTYTFPSTGPYATGPYAIEVTSYYAGQTGAFTLSVDCGITLKGFSLAPATVTGGNTSLATLSLTQPAPGSGVQVALTSSAAAAPVPALVTVPGGQTQVTVPIRTAAVTAGTTATLTAKLAATTQAALTAALTVNPPGTPPAVAITSPTNASPAFTAPGPISLTASATASGTGVTISRVEFFADATDLGGATASPYTLSWSSVGPGTYALTARATDSHGLVATSAPVTVTVGTAGTVATPVIAPPGGGFTSTQSVTITDATAGAAIYYTLDGTDPTPASARYTGAFPLFSRTQVKAKAFLANYTPSATQSALFTFTAAGGTDPQPVVQINSPVEDANLTGPTPVVGSVSIGSLASWQLSYRLVNQTTSPGGAVQDVSTGWTQFAAGSSSVTNQTLGTLDTTLLLNGLYEIQLSAVDNNGLSATAVVRVTVSGNQKVGYFTFAYTDLTLPVAGLPIQVTRTYDSRDKSPGDFGIGWKLGLTNIRLQKDGAIGDGWNNAVSGGFLSLYSVVPARSHLVTITFPTGECFRFEASLSNGSDYAPPSGSSVDYYPLPGTKGSLTIAGNHYVLIPPGFPQNNVELIDADSDTGANFDRTEFLLTTADGRQFDLDQFQGLLSVRDRNGNLLTFSHNGNAVTGITSTSLDASGNTVAGRGVSFTRTNGFITQIQDLNGGRLVYGQTGNDLTTFTDRANNATTYTYDAGHNVTGIKDARNLFPLRNEYDGSGRLLDTLDAHGHKITYTYNAPSGYDPKGARQETVTDRLGRPTLIGYDAYGNVTSRRQYLLDGQGNLLRTITTSASFADANNPDKPTHTVDALGRITDIGYDAAGNALSVTQYLPDADGFLQPLVTTTSYNAFGQPLTVTDALQKVVTTNTYDDAGNLKVTKDALGNETKFSYNPNGTLQFTLDALGCQTNYQYDPARPGDVSQVTDAKNHATSFTYDGDGNKKTQTTTRTTPSGPQTLSTLFDYDASDRLQKTTYPDNATSQTFYNSLGKVDYTLDALSRKTSYTYDELGQLTKTTSPDNATATTVYDDGGQVTSRTDRAGRISGAFYDSLGRTVASGALDAQGNFLRDALGNPVYASTYYDDAGQVLAQVDERGNATQFAYDALGRKVGVMDALKKVTWSSFDADGRQTSVLDANNHQTTYDYDDAGRLTVTHYHDGSTSTTKYDALGRRTDQTDQAGHTTHDDYDELGRLVKVTDPLFHVTTFGYDELGEKISQTDANTHTTLFAYDSRGRLVQKTLPGNQADGRTYDALGRLKTQTDFNGKVTAFGYDPASGRLLTKTAYASAAAYASNAPSGEGVSFTYYADGTRRTARRTATSGTVTTTYAYYGYDANGATVLDFRQGRLKSVTNNVGTLTYDYDAAGNKTGMQSPSMGAGHIAYSYDALNRLSTVTHTDGATTTFAYDNAGNRQSVTRLSASGALFSKTTYSYDALNRLTNQVNTNGSGNLVSGYLYQLRADSKRLSVAESGPGTSGSTTTYTYDDGGKLTQEAGPYGTVAYGYDSVGNRLTKTISGSTTAALINGQTVNTYDANDRITSQSGPAGNVAHTYDADGNETTVNGQGASYDFENHLIGLSGGTTYTYDADGNRVGVTTGGVTTSYVVDTSLPYASVVEEYTGNTLSARYDYGDDLVRMDRGSGVYYYLYDGLGSTRQLVNTGGSVTDGYSYDAFGEGLSHSPSSGVLNPFLFNAQQFDTASGDYYLRARYYDPTIGRFLSQDPLQGSNEDPITLHRYLYADADPQNIFDPSGKEGIGEAAVVVGAIAVIGLPLVDLGFQTIVQVGSTSSAWSARGHHYPDITVPLQQVVNRIELKWYALRTDPVMRAKMAKTLTDLDLSNPFASPAANAWDIIGLNSASNPNGWIDQASSPMLDGHSPDLRMVVVDGQTFHSYSAN